MRYYFQEKSRRKKLTLKCSSARGRSPEVPEWRDQYLLSYSKLWFNYDKQNTTSSPEIFPNKMGGFPLFPFSKGKALGTRLKSNSSLYHVFPMEIMKLGMFYILIQSQLQVSSWAFFRFRVALTTQGPLGNCLGHFFQLSRNKKGQNRTRNILQYFTNAHKYRRGHRKTQHWLARLVSVGPEHRKQKWQEI